MSAKAQELFGRHSFGPDRWQSKFGFNVNPAPFPWHVADVRAECPFNPGKPVHDTHFAFYLPSIVIADGTAHALTALWYAKRHPPTDPWHLDWVGNWLEDNQNRLRPPKPPPPRGAWLLSPLQPPEASLNISANKQRRLKPKGYDIAGPDAAILKRLLMIKSMAYPSYHTIRLDNTPGTKLYLHLELGGFGPIVPGGAMSFYEGPGVPKEKIGMEYIRQLRI